MSARSVIKISVSPSAKTTISQVAKKHGMKELEVASRVYDWFASQTDVIQKGVLRLLPEGYEETLVRLVVEKLGPPAAIEKKKPR